MQVTDNFLTQEQFEDIKFSLLSQGNMNVFLSDYSVPDDGVRFAYHTIVKRPEDNEDCRSTISSPQLMPIVNLLLGKSGAENPVIFRAAVNISFLDRPERNLEWHDDHSFDYKHLIYYLTTNEDAPTVIKDDSGDDIIVDAVENRAVIFNKRLHRSTLPKFGLRALIVVTYK
jgi:hypothetical protein